MEKDTSLVGKDLRGADLRGADLTRKVLFGTDLRGADLSGCEISVNCDTFDGVVLSDDQVAWLLCLISKASSNEVFERALRGLCIDVLGVERYRAMRRMSDLV